MVRTDDEQAGIGLLLSSESVSRIEVGEIKWQSFIKDLIFKLSAIENLSYFATF
jgi:hypothetical protein